MHYLQLRVQELIPSSFGLGPQGFHLAWGRALRRPTPSPSPPPVLTHVEAHRSMPWDSMPLIFWGFRLHRTTTSRSRSSSSGTNCTRPLTTVRGSASPTSIFSTYRLSASGCCARGQPGWDHNALGHGRHQGALSAMVGTTPRHRLLRGPWSKLSPGPR